MHIFLEEDQPEMEPPRNYENDANDTNDTNDANDANDANDTNDANDANDANDVVSENIDGRFLVLLLPAIVYIQKY